MKAVYLKIAIDWFLMSANAFLIGAVLRAALG
jgi:hypothetical protein